MKKLLITLSLMMTLMLSLGFVACGEPTKEHKLEKVERSAATCTQEGNVEYWECSECHKIFSDSEGKTEITKADTVLAIVPHTLEKHAAKAATCTEVGNIEYWTCSVCGKYFSDSEGKNEITKADTVSALVPHTLEKHAAKAATCTEAGNIEYWTCSVCNKYFSDSEGKKEIAKADTVLAIVPHTLEKHAAKAATCTETGNIEYWTCSVCNKYFSDSEGKNEITKADTVLAIVPHTLEKHAAKAATCTQEGNVEYWECSECHKIFSDSEGKNEIAKADTVLAIVPHTLEKHAAKAATCTETGNIEYWTCSVCNKYFSDSEGKNEITKSDTVSALVPHTLEKHAAKAATCTEVGNIEYWTCSVCGKYFSDSEGKNEITKSDTVSAIVPHTLEKHAAKAATCTEAGNIEYWTCSVCNKYFSDSEGKNEITKADTVLAIVPHTLEKHAAKAATCTEAGNIEYWTCSVCNKYFSDSKGKNEITKADTVLAIVSHTLEKHAAKAATCTEAGNIEYWTCSVCNKYFSDSEGKNEITKADTVLAIVPHTLEKHAAKAATCTETGNIEYWTCSVCNKYFSDSKGKNEITKADTVLAIVPHTLEKHDAKEATCTEAGNIEYWTCSVCGKYFSDSEGKKEIQQSDTVVKALNHDFVHHEAKEATYASAGSKEYWECKRCNKLFADAEGKTEIAAQDIVLEQLFAEDQPSSFVTAGLPYVYNAEKQCYEADYLMDYGYQDHVSTFTIRHQYITILKNHGATTLSVTVKGSGKAGIAKADANATDIGNRGPVVKLKNAIDLSNLPQDPDLVDESGNITLKIYSDSNSHFEVYISSNDPTNPTRYIESGLPYIYNSAEQCYQAEYLAEYGYSDFVSTFTIKKEYIDSLKEKGFTKLTVYVSGNGLVGIAKADANATDISNRGSNVRLKNAFDLNTLAPQADLVDENGNITLKIYSDSNSLFKVYLISDDPSNPMNFVETGLAYIYNHTEQCYEVDYKGSEKWGDSTKFIIKKSYIESVKAEGKTKINVRVTSSGVVSLAKADPNATDIALRAASAEYQFDLNNLPTDQYLVDQDGNITLKNYSIGDAHFKVYITAE